ncbi:MAG: peptidoglycan-binding protein, partial [Microcoleus sp.]
MESLAYLELALVCEAPAESKIFDAPKWQNRSSQTYVYLLSLALMLSVLSAAGSAFAQIDPGNPSLRSVQDRLRDLGYFPRTSTGQLGPVTKQALTNFQRDYQLSLTGRPDTATVTALNSLAADDRPFKTTYTNYSYTELSFGDTGAEVSQLQRRLKQLGYFNTHPTGNFREVTVRAVRYFQRINRLRVTGVADRQTLALLFGSISPIPPVTLPGDISGNGGCKGLRFGDRGATVDLIQRQLKALGYFEGGVDGKFRERTLYAVTRFQQDYHLVSDGCADTATLTAIDAQMKAAQITSFPAENDNESNGNFIELGDRGRQVEFVQRRLQQLGYYRSQIHGWFDRPTQAALIRFQRDSGLFGTGRVDRSTRSALRQGNRQAAAPVPQLAAGLRGGG